MVKRKTKKRRRRASATPRARTNPVRAKRTYRRRRKNPTKGKRFRPVLYKTRAGWKRPTKSKLMPKPVRINRRRRKARRNPKFSVKRLLDRRLLMSAVKVGGGIAVGFIGMPVVYRVLPQGMKNAGTRKWLGGIHVLLGLSMSMLKNKTVREMGYVVAGTGVYDLIAVNIPDLGLTPLPTSSVLVDKMLGSGVAEPQALDFNQPVSLDFNQPMARDFNQDQLMGLAFSNDSPYEDMY